MNLGQKLESEVEVVSCKKGRTSQGNFIHLLNCSCRCSPFPCFSLSISLSVLCAATPTTTQQHRRCSTVPSRRRAPATPPSQPTAVSAATAAGLVFRLSSRRLLCFGRDKLPTGRLILTTGDHCLHYHRQQTPASVNHRRHQALMGRRRPSHGCPCPSACPLFVSHVEGPAGARPPVPPQNADDAGHRLLVIGRQHSPELPSPNPSTWLIYLYGKVKNLTFSLACDSGELILKFF
uniref:Uncharacterized protein n=1 Tax=Opuntia streptacantha TaxID=393608 RepID=A0A7C9B1U8_OPUST